MIAQLIGRIASQSIDELIVDVGGVGYLVHVPVGTAGRLKPDDDGQVRLVVHTNVREDAIQLFGFAGDVEKRVFLKLTSITGVGPKLALSILSDLSVPEIVRAVQAEDLAQFTRVSGVGKKTGARLLLELKNAFGDLAIPTPMATPASAAANGAVLDDLRSALGNLGYKPNVVEDLVSRIAPMVDDDTPLESMLRKALKLVS